MQLYPRDVHPLAGHAAALLRASPVRAEPLAGGFMGPVLRLAFSDGRSVVAKGGASPPREAEMLRALTAAGAPTPAVLAVDERVLVLEACPADGALEGVWGDLGEVLARLHGATMGDRYGWAEDDAFGPLPIPNAWSDDWPTFWAERRLLAHVERMPPGVARRVEVLARDLPGRLPARPRASLVHGDLWSGNVLTSRGRVSALIDPAAYVGHGEVDLAMLTLFGSPDPAFFDAYGAEPAWRERQPIYQLWPALVHLQLFGEGYRGMAQRLLGAAGV
jgi:fructosamine-3-kinase